MLILAFFYWNYYKVTLFFRNLQWLSLWWMGSKQMVKHINVYYTDWLSNCPPQVLNPICDAIIPHKWRIPRQYGSVTLMQGFPTLGLWSTTRPQPIWIQAMQACAHAELHLREHLYAKLHYRQQQVRALTHEASFARARHLHKWSCVRSCMHLLLTQNHPLCLPASPPSQKSWQPLLYNDRVLSLLGLTRHIHKKVFCSNNSHP